MDRRRVIYYKSCIVIARSVEIDSNAEKMGMKIIRDIIKDPKMVGSTLCLIGYVPLSMGLNMNPLIERFGMLAAQAMLDKHAKTSADDIYALIEEIVRSYSPIPTELVIDDDSIVIMQKTEDHIKPEAQVFNIMLIGAIRMLVYPILNARHYVSEGWEEDGRSCIRLNKIPGYTEGMIPILSRSAGRDDWEYSVYLVNGRSILFGNHTQIQILEALNKKMLSLKQLSNVLDIPAVTVHVNLAKLLEIGAIQANDERGTKYMRYRLVSVPLLTPCKKTPEIGRNIEKLMKENAVNPEDYSKNIFKYINYAFRMTGVDSGGLLYKAGRDFAKALVDSNKGIEPQDFIGLVTDVSPDHHFNVDVVSYIPLRLALSGECVGYVEPKHVESFYTGMIEAGLEELLGINQSVTFVEKK